MLAMALAKSADDDLDAPAVTEPSETLTLTIAEMQRQPTEDGLDSWLLRSGELIASFDHDDRALFEAAVATRREAWGK